MALSHVHLADLCKDRRPVVAGLFPDRGPHMGPCRDHHESFINRINKYLMRDAAIIQSNVIIILLIYVNYF